MKLPWNKNTENDPEKEKLEAQLTEKEEKIEKLENMLEAEKKRRSNLAREKQGVEEKINRLKDKLRNIEQEKPETQNKNEKRSEPEPVNFSKSLSVLEKLDSIESREKDLVTVYSPESLNNIEDLRGLKNSISKEQYSEIEGLESFTAFLNQDIGNTILEMRPFFDSKFVAESFFDIRELLDFIRSEKYWVLVSAGNTQIFQEVNGDHEEIESIKSRVDREHSKGGFSQGRFERKREEQIEKHVKQVRNVLKDFDGGELYILGDKKLCEDLPGRYLGGFNPNRKKPEQFYQFRLTRF